VIRLPAWTARAAERELDPAPDPKEAA